MSIRNIFSIVAISTLAQLGLTQDNCNVFKWAGDSCRYKACKYLEDSKTHFQLTREYHEIKDEALNICPEYAVVYKHKSTAYLKTGDFITWKKLIDKAVELNPQENINYRGWCRFQFFRDYEGAIADIEEMERIFDGDDIGHCQNGYYHLIIAKGLCYKMLGQKAKALEIIKNQIEIDGSNVGMFDNLHLGVLYLEQENYNEAIIAFQKQIETNELAEVHYYLSLVYKGMNNNQAYLESLLKAKKLYQNEIYMFDVYTHQVDKIFMADIKKELKNAELALK